MAGILAALVFGNVFTGCENEDTGGGNTTGLTVPKTEDLPELPEGSTAVSSENDATALLGALANVSNSIDGAIWTAIMTELGSESAANNPYDIEDVTGNNVKVTAKRTNITASQGPFEVDDPVKETQEQTRQGVVTADTTVGESTVVQGSSFGQEWSYGMDLKTTVAGDLANAKFTGTLSFTERYVYGLTATGAGGKSARIILDAAVVANVTLTNQTLSQAQSAATITYGSLKVYGAGAEPVYTLSITNAATYQEAVGYFGIEDE
jgi:hypothetical protein